jgi:lysophospholipase L1-like esterase
MNRKAITAVCASGITMMFLAAAFAQNVPATNPSGTPATNPARAGRGLGRRGGRGVPAPYTGPLFPESAVAALPRVDQTWGDRHMALLQRAKQGNIDLYLEGDSITDNWGSTRYTDSYHKYFDGWKTADFGIGGDRTEHVIWRLQNGELDGVNPKVIMLLVGTNNIPPSQYHFAPVPPQAAADGVKIILDLMKEKAPAAKILIVSVFPREDQPDMNVKVKELNSLISKFADGQQIKYLDIYDKFLGPDGKLLPGLMNTDNLHPDNPGYDIWGQAMTPILTDWLGAPAK